MTASALPGGWLFEDPPPSTSRRGSRIDYGALVANPGRWVRTSARYSSAASTARKTAEKRHGGRWESTVRPDPTDKKKSLVYLRYLGPDEKPAAIAKPARASIVPVAPARVCSCGKEIADDDAWKRHNDTIVNPKDHKLTMARAS